MNKQAETDKEKLNRILDETVNRSAMIDMVQKKIDGVLVRAIPSADKQRAVVADCEGIKHGGYGKIVLSVDNYLSTEITALRLKLIAEKKENKAMKKRISSLEKRVDILLEII